MLVEKVGDGWMSERLKVVRKRLERGAGGFAYIMTHVHRDCIFTRFKMSIKGSQSRKIKDTPKGLSMVLLTWTMHVKK